MSPVVRDEAAVSCVRDVRVCPIFVGCVGKCGVERAEAFHLYFGFAFCA